MMPTRMTRDRVRAHYYDNLGYLVHVASLRLADESFDLFIRRLYTQSGKPRRGIAPWLELNDGRQVQTLQVQNPDGTKNVWTPGPRKLTVFSGNKIMLDGSIRELKGFSVMYRSDTLLAVQGDDSLNTTCIYWVGDGFPSV